MNPARLIEVATQLTLSSDDTPRHQERLRRAVSTAYYAIFHALANSNADTLIGARTNREDSEAWNRTYRALDHGTARSRFRQASQMASFPNAVREFAEAFNRLQGERHAADYNPDHTFTVSGTLRTINHARQAVLILYSVPETTRRNLATYVLFGNRPN